MGGYVFFQMYGPFRRTLIAQHNFYVEQAGKRLLSQFDDIGKEADEASERWLVENGPRFDPDRHDQGDFYDSANDAGVEFYQLLSNMRDRTRLSVVAGMFHEWEKQLRDWLAKEILHWHRGEAVQASVWKADFGMIADLLECLGWKIRATSYFNTLDACRLVVNVYKHGDGTSFDDLKLTFPEYLDNGLVHNGARFGTAFLDHTHLVVNDEQLVRFSDAIREFWEDVPETVTGSVTPLPNWFAKAMQKDGVAP